MTTLLSTRQLLALSELPAGAVHGATTARAEARTNPENAKVPSRVSQSRDLFQVEIHEDDDDCVAPTLIGPGDATGIQTVPSPVRFRWNAARGADRYRLVYSVESGNGKDVVGGETRNTELTIAVPAGVIKWKVYAMNNSGEDGCMANSTNLKFISVGTCQAPSNASASASSTRVTAGQSVTLTANASGTAPLHYQWFAGSTPVGTDSSTYTTGPLTQTTTFKVAVSNGCGSVNSNNVTVDICTPPSIAAQPQAKSITSGESATLTVAANGTGPFTYQWFAGSQPVGTNSNSLNTGTLTQTTTYRVEVRNACGMVMSNTATVTVTKACVPAAVVESPANKVIDEATAGVLEVLASGSEPLLYQWFEGTQGERGKPVGTNNRRFVTPSLTETKHYWVEVRNDCGVASSRTATVAVTPRQDQQPDPQCPPFAAVPEPRAIAVVTSGVEYAVRWSAVAGASRYTVEEANVPDFSNASAQVVTTTIAVYRHVTTTALSKYYRVRASSACDGTAGAFSRPIRVAIVPEPASTATTTDLIAPHGTVNKLTTLVDVQLDPAATSFTAEASETWMTVSPAAGSVPANGRITFTVTVNPAELPHGTSIGSLRVTTTASSSTSRLTTNATSTVTTPISISLVTPVAPPSSNNPGVETLIIPAVAHADGANSRWQSDVRIANGYPSSVRYLLLFTPSGVDRSSSLQTEVTVAGNQTVALDDILGRWFGSGMGAAGQTGVLEIRALDAPKGLGQTFATSRLFNLAESGSFGQFIPAVPLSQFLAQSTGRQSLVALAQSIDFRTNLGVVAGSGFPVSAMLEVFSADGAKLYATTLDLKPGEHRQVSSLLATQGISSSNARVDVRIVSPVGSVYSYASVVDNSTGDPSFVPPADSSAAPAQRYTIAGVADLVTPTGKWQTDVRLFNGGPAAVTATLAFFRQGQSEPAATREITVASNEVVALDDVLQSRFGITGAGGALRITTATDSALVPAARTYHKRDGATYGQFVPAATQESAAALGGRALRILQVEESVRFRTNIGVTEVSGKPATVEIIASVPGRKTSTVMKVTLGPNQFLQMNSLLKTMGLTDAYNASMSVRVVEGEGRVIAYGSVVDNSTLDPTYVMAQ